MEILRFIFNLITEYGLFVVWGIAFVLLIFYFYCFFQKFKNNRGKVVDDYSVLMFISLLTSGFLILLPADKNNPGFNILESIYCSLKLFYADGTARFNLEGTMLNIMYRSMYYVLCFLAPLTLVCTVLSHFDNFINLIKIHKYAILPKRNIIIFSELNYKNLAIVENFKNYKLPEEKKNNNSDSEDDNNIINNDFFNYDKYRDLEANNKKVFIFCDVYKQNTEASYELIEKALEMECILLKEDIVSIHKLIRKILVRTSKGKLTRYFLSSSDENENVSQAVEITKIENEKESKLKNLALFTFAEQDANGYILEALNTCDDFFVLRLKPSLMTAIDILTNKDNWLIKTKKDSEKDLKVIILGLGKYGFEIGKFLSWYYQREKGNISIHFVDKENEITKHLSGSYYDFLNFFPNLYKRDQNACFNIKTHEGIDVFSYNFTQLLEDIYYKDTPGLDAVFCVLGDDNTNIEAALHTRKLLDRLNYEELSNINLDSIDKIDSTVKKFTNYYIDENVDLKDNIRIFSVVNSDRIKKNLDSSSGFIQDCNIDFVGEDSSVYSCTNIFDPKLEAKKARKRGTSLLNYNSNEYKRLSSISEVLHFKYIESIYTKNNAKKSTKEYIKMRRKIGNKRWNAYMLSIGYTHFDNVPQELLEKLFKIRKKEKNLPMRKWHRGKWHNSIVPFDMLPEDEQNNNYTPKIKITKRFKTIQGKVKLLEKGKISS